VINANAVFKSSVLAGDGVVIRGQAYGIRGIRVDGNDALAVYSAVHAAREMAIAEGRPILVEVQNNNNSTMLHYLKQQNLKSIIDLSIDCLTFRP
jgi:hypothetical protein